VQAVQALGDRIGTLEDKLGSGVSTLIQEIVNLKQELKKSRSLEIKGNKEHEIKEPTSMLTGMFNGRRSFRQLFL